MTTKRLTGLDGLQHLVGQHGHRAELAGLERVGAQHLAIAQQVVLLGKVHDLEQLDIVHAILELPQDVEHYGFNLLYFFFGLHKQFISRFGGLYWFAKIQLFLVRFAALILFNYFTIPFLYLHHRSITLIAINWNVN